MVATFHLRSVAADRHLAHTWHVEVVSLEHQLLTSEVFRAHFLLLCELSGWTGLLSNSYRGRLRGQ